MIFCQEYPKVATAIKLRQSIRLRICDNFAFGPVQQYIEVKCRAPPRRGCCRYGPPHKFNQRLRDRESQSRSAKSARNGSIGLLEALEQTGCGFRREPDTRIPYGEAYAATPSVIL